MLIPERLPANDGGVAYGQANVSARRLALGVDAVNAVDGDRGERASAATHRLDGAVVADQHAAVVGPEQPPPRARA